MISDNGDNAGDGFQFKSVNGVLTLASDHNTIGTYDETILTITGNDDDASKTVAVTGDLTLTISTPPTNSSVVTKSYVDTLVAGLGSSSGGSTNLSGNVTVGGDFTVTGSDIVLGNGANGTITSEATTGANVSGKDLILVAGNGTGTGGSGDIIFKTAPVAGSGSTANTLAAMLTVGKTGVTVAGDIEAGTGSATGIFKSNSNQDVQLKTGNSTTGSITITDGANGNITLAPDGSGDVLLSADTVQIGDNNSNATITTNGTGDLILNTNSGTNSGNITIADGNTGEISISPEGSGNLERYFIPKFSNIKSRYWS